MSSTSTTGITTGSGDDTDELPGAGNSLVFVAEVMINSVSLFFMILLFLLHHFKVYQDFFTVERKSVQHRRHPPEKTPSYKYVAMATSLWIISGGYWCLIKVLSYAFSEISCLAVLLLTSLGGFAKLGLYLSFAFRLHLVYQGSKYAINPKKLFGWTSFISFYIFIWFAVVDVGYLNDEDETWYFDTRGHHPDGIDVKICYADWGDFNGLLVAAFIIPDLIANIVFCYCFIKPIRAILRDVRDSSRSVLEVKKLSKKMLRVGYKVAILGIASIVSTFFIWLVVGATGSSITGIDIVINSVCLMFMTPYYPDDIYYSRWCKLCICCCDCKGYTTYKEVDEVKSLSPPSEENGNEFTYTRTEKSGTSDIGGSSTGGPSVDTMSAVRVTAQADAASSNGFKSTEAELAQLQTSGK